MSDNPEIIDVPNEGRLEIFVDGARADLVYRVHRDRLVIEHTRVPDNISRRGIGGMLAAAAVDKAIERGLTVVPVCPFVAAWLRKHPDAAERVTIDWTDGG